MKNSIARRRFPLALALLPTLVAGALLSGCSKVPDTIKIGVAQPLSGPLGALGQDLLNGVNLAVKELNRDGFMVDGKRYAPGFDRREPEMVEAIKTILHAAHKAGKRAALHNGTPDYAAEAAGWGFDLVTVSNDVRLLAGAAEASVKRFRELVQEIAPVNTIDTGGY